MNKLCCIFNLAPHYRSPIYRLMDKELSCDFYFGDKVLTPIKPMDYDSLKGFKGVLHNKYLYKGIYWQKGVVGLLFKPYEKYIMTGERFILSTWAALILGRLLNKQVYLWSHGDLVKRGFIRTLIKKIFFSLPHCTFLYGDNARNQMIKDGIDPSKLVCIYNSLDYDLQLKERERLEKGCTRDDYFKNDNPNIIFTGRLQRNKQLTLLLESALILKQRGLSINITFVGSGNDEDRLKRKVSELGLENVRFYGACYDESILSELIYQSDICVSPGEVGLTAIHSLSYGTPLITHSNKLKQMPEFESIKDGETGLLFEEGNVNDLAEKIEKWCAYSKSNREVIRKNCYAIVDERYNIYKQLEVLSIIGEK